MIIHPFFFFKREIAWGDHYNSRCSLDFKSVCSSWHIQKAGFEEKAIETLETYKKGVEYAEDGSAIIYRSVPFDENLEIEKQLFAYAQQCIPSSNLLFCIPLDKKENGDEEGYDVIEREFIHHLGDSAPEVQLYGFGEDIGGCVPWLLDRVRRTYGIKKQPIVLTQFSKHNPSVSLEERLKELRYRAEEFDLKVE